MINLGHTVKSGGGKFSSNGADIEIQAAEVIEVNYKDDSPEQIYNIKVVPLSSESLRTKQMAISARPLDYNIKKLPLLGEVVMIIRGPSAGGGAIGGSSQNYYITTYAIQSLIHHNGLPDITKTGTGAGGIDKASYSNTEAGHTKNNDVRKNGKKNIFANSFVERNDVRPIQPYAGDVIIEGRYNQSIRFSSTLNDSVSDYTLPPSWKKGKSIFGDPLTVIRNGRINGSVSTKPNKFYVENVKEDDSSIWMTSGQTIPYFPKYANFKSIDRLGVNTFKVGENYTGNQLGLFSDRIIIATKQQEVLIQSEGGVAINTANNMAIDCQNTFEINSNRINLGISATEPALLGNKSGEWLSKLLASLTTLCNTLAIEVHPTGVGPSLPPIQAPVYTNVANDLIKLQQQIPSLKSDLVFLNKSPAGDFSPPSLSEAEEAEFVLSPEETQELESTVRSADAQINDPSLPPDAKAAAEEKKEYAQAELTEGKKVAKQDLSSNKSLRDKINNTPDKYKCKAAEGAINSAINDIGIMEFVDPTNLEFKGGMNFGGFPNGENRRGPGRIDEMISNAGLNNKGKTKNYTTEGFYWCASATATWWKEGGIATPGLSGKASCENWKQWAIKNGYWSATPKQGALIVYAKDGGGRAHHIGMVVAVSEAGVITSIEGNTSGKGFDRNGGGCFVKTPRKFDGFIIPPSCS